MNKKLIVGLSSLLKIEQDVIVKALENEDGDNGVISKFLEENNVFTLPELTTLKKNSEDAGKLAGVKELETADKFPSAIYGRVKGLVIEKAEKEIAEKHGVTEWKGLNDLASKIADQGKGGDSEKDKQIEILKKSLTDKGEEMETAVKGVKEKYTKDFTNRDFNSAEKSLILDLEEDASKNQKALYSSAFKNQFKLDYRDDLEKTVVLDTEGKLVVTKTGDPETVANVYTGFALQHGAKVKAAAPGGRGTGSSDPNNNLKGISLSKYMESKGVKANTEEGDKAYATWRASNPKTE